MESSTQTKFPLVVIIGAGFGGLRVAKGLEDQPVDVLMLDKHNYHVFQPLLYQVATGSLEAESIAFSIRKNFSDQKNFRFRIAEVTGVDTEAQTLDTTIGDIKYDYLVIATGSTTNFFGNKQIEKFAMPMKSIPEALNLRYLILQNLESAVLEKSKEAREPYLNFVLVGAGPTGVELAGALAELRNHVLARDYPELKREDMRVYLVDFLPKVLGPMSDEASAKAKDFLVKMGVDVLLNVKVESYDGEVIKFEDGRTIITRNVIWSAGVMGVVPKGVPETEILRGNKIKTDNISRIAGLDNVFAIGDVAAVIDEETPKGHPGVAQVAIQQGDLVAKNIINIMNGAPTKPFKYNDKGSLATIGRNKAVADLGKIKFQGFFAWLVWMFVHLISLLGFRNKVVVFVNWISSYVNNNGGTRLILRRFVREDVPKDAENLPNTES
ncbi:NAD(P)/FAD-dependent oxidoreductase [Mucilaginibacter myungsuensis]|uniref:NADH:ubiquinone reductase (non-electrogenic) n=1 Tax=Mucilaginibacter myungsuensis TaxID=649104 RepID=A0A929PWV5_9SPHI|nr:NAD(P)/FAD-dependent oxidoreductase [Mucilaginibacter myungsuensis]MBE9662496.1 NAD(P)/FAD-dependent oxidoreductase [Mucilaginibacter myungsuensis]MDN3597915.1 NAD(P)/FAD-dependent oxidoreductase [Mucilaginibacter myungsuensis]